MTEENMSDHLHSKVSAQDVRIGGIEHRLGNVEVAVTDGFAAMAIKLDSNAATAKPTTQFVLWIVGGLISVTMLLFINPLRDRDIQHDANFSKSAEVSLKLAESSAALSERTLHTEKDIKGYGYDIRANREKISKQCGDVAALKAQVDLLLNK